MKNLFIFRHGKIDLRKLSVSAQETIRFKVLQALDSGVREVDIMRNFGVSDAVIYKWIKVRETRKKREVDLLKLA